MTTNKNPHPKDYQVGGDHYKNLPIQPVDYIIQNKLGWLEGSIVKYVTRHHVKGGRQDIEKVIHYAEMLLAEYDEVADDEPVQYEISFKTEEDLSKRSHLLTNVTTADRTYPLNQYGASIGGR